MKWPEIRAGLIALAMAFALIDGCPIPPRAYTPAWESGFVEPIRAARHIALVPMAWFGRTFQIAQQWSLYQAPIADRFRMWIEGRSTDGSWTLVYRAGDPDHTEDAQVIEHARVWGTWDPTDHPPAEYATVAGWLTARVLARHADFVAARIRMEKITLGVGDFTPTGVFVWPYQRVRP